jgi:hypothetical protein
VLAESFISFFLIAQTEETPEVVHFQSPSLAIEVNVTPEEVATHIEKSIYEVPAFKFIAENAAKLGIKHAYLFGGTATGFAYYTVDDLRRTKGDKRYIDGRFDFDYSQIYRSSQDADIVIDGTPEQAGALEALVRQNQSFLIGYKTKWEMRTLRYYRGSKPPLLNDFQFENQHTDSASVGLIEITQPEPGTPRIRDLRFWENPLPPFLVGLAEGTIFFYFGGRHDETEMAKHGLNPPIISVARMLAKVAQYRLTLDEQDKTVLKKIIAAFDPHTGLKTSYARDRLIEFGMKCMQGASDVLYAWNILEELGLRKKLMQLGNQDLAYWADRKPLPAFPVGQGIGHTAKELGIDRVAHTTKNFKFYESITSSPMGLPNVFTSRTHVAGESAAMGEGFYTLQGKDGIWDDGFNARFTVLPNARNHEDFEYSALGYVLMRNRDAFRVVHESISLTPIQFLRRIVDQKWDEGDLGLLMRFRRRISAQANIITLTREQDLEAQNLIGKLIRLEAEGAYRFFVDAGQKPSDLIKMIPALRNTFDRATLNDALKTEIHADIVRVAQTAMQLDLAPEVLEQLVKKADGVALRNLVSHGFSKPESMNHDSLLRQVAKHPDATPAVWEAMVVDVFSQPFHANKFDILEWILKHHWSEDLGSKVAEFVLPKAHAAEYLEKILPILIEKGQRRTRMKMIEHFFSSEAAKNYLNSLQGVIQSDDPFPHRAMARFIFPKPFAQSRKDLAQLLYQRGDIVTKQMLLRDCPNLVRELAKK